MCCGRLLAGTGIPGVEASSPSAHLHLEPTPTAARQARAFLGEHAGALSQAAADAATVCASELVTNGVLHARTPLVFGVTAGERLLVTVADQSDGRPYTPDQDDERASGRGILLVDALADQWGIDDTVEGKTVWFTIVRDRA